jgi:hypothetical protein
MKNIKKIVEKFSMELPEMYTQQLRDYASDCPVRSAITFDNVQSGTVRYSGETIAILANTNTDKYIFFTDNTDYVPTIKIGFKKYCEKVLRLYER